MIESLIAAIDAVAFAEKYAAKVGMQIRFAAEDVRAMALTILIGRTGGRRMNTRTLSPYQVNTFLSCSYSWHCMYVEKLPSEPSAPMALGSAVHSTVAVALRAKRQDYNMDLPELLNDYYDEAAHAHFAEARFSLV